MSTVRSAVPFVLLGTLAALAGCPHGDDDSPKVADAGKGTVDLTALLHPAQFDQYDGPFADRTPAPNLTSMEQNPAFALGTVFVRRAKAGKPCDSTDAADFVTERLPDFRKPGCEEKVFPSRTIATKKIKGGASVNLKYVVGDVASNADYAFELLISEPMTAVFPSASACLDLEALLKAPLPERTCSVNYITGAVLTQISYRTFVDLKGSSNNAFSVMSIGGSLYRNEDDFQSRQFLTVDFLGLGQYYATTAEGYLKKGVQVPGGIALPADVGELIRPKAEASLLKAGALGRMEGQDL